MPYLCVHSQALPIEQKRVMAQKLIEITLRTFHLRAEERNQITIQFISQAPERGSDLKDADFTLEVIGHDLTEEKKAAFTEETAGMMTHPMPLKPSGLIARLLGAKADTPRQIALQFHELSPAIKRSIRRVPAAPRSVINTAPVFSEGRWQQVSDSQSVSRDYERDGDFTTPMCADRTSG